MFQTHLNNLLTLSFGCTNYRVMSGSQPSFDGSPDRVVAAVMVHNEIVAEGESSSGKYAKLKASSNALGLLQGLAPFEYRMQYHCDCSDEKSEATDGMEEGPKQHMGDGFDSAI